MQDTSKACHEKKKEYEIQAGDGKEAFWGVINTLEGKSPMDQINKLVLNSPVGSLPVYCLLTVYQGPVVQSAVSLTSSLVVKMLTVLVSTVSNSQVFLLKKKCE